MSPISASHEETPIMKPPLSSWRRRPSRKVRGRRPGVEALEARSLLSTIVGLTEDNRLLRFDSDNPGQILATTAIRGLAAGESVVGIDVRPSTGQLFGLGRSGRLYVIDANTGAATTRAVLHADPSDTTAPFTGLSGGDFGVDFNPAADRLRVVSNAEQNLRIN